MATHPAAPVVVVSFLLLSTACESSTRADRLKIAFESEAVCEQYKKCSAIHNRLWENNNYVAADVRNKLADDLRDCMEVTKDTLKKEAYRAGVVSHDVEAFWEKYRRDAFSWGALPAIADLSSLQPDGRATSAMACPFRVKP
jgi:hypothetical protein